MGVFMTDIDKRIETLRKAANTAPSEAMRTIWQSRLNLLERQRDGVVTFESEEYDGQE